MSIQHRCKGPGVTDETMGLGKVLVAKMEEWGRMTWLRMRAEVGARR